MSKYHQPVSFIWSSMFPPLQKYLDFRCPKNIAIYCLFLDVMCLTKTNGPNNSICVLALRRDRQNEWNGYFYLSSFHFTVFAWSHGIMLLAIDVVDASWSLFTFASKKKIMKNELKKTSNIFIQMYAYTDTHHWNIKINCDLYNDDACAWMLKLDEITERH